MRKLAMVLIFLVLASALVPAKETKTKEAALRERLRTRLIAILPAVEIERIFRDPRLKTNPALVRRKKPGGRKKPDYSFILTDSSVRRGKTYLREYPLTMFAAERKYKIPKEVLAGILRIETNFGADEGVYPVITTLYTRYIFAADEGKRAAEFGEFLAFLQICRAEKLDPFAIKGSSEGAFGMPQFMPSSYRLFAVDGDGDGTIDLFSNDADAIFSVANYLKAHGWDDSESGREKALYAYNHEHAYVRAVLAYARALKNEP